MLSIESFFLNTHCIVGAGLANRLTVMFNEVPFCKPIISWVFLFILVEPHLNVDIPSSHEIIGLQNGTSLNITVNLLANPAPTIQWVFRKNDSIDNIIQSYSSSIVHADIVIHYVWSIWLESISCIFFDCLFIFVLPFKIKYIDYFNRFDPATFCVPFPSQ
jgi:hypothetical protein